MGSIPYIPASEERIKERLQEAVNHVRYAVQVLEDYLDRDLYGHASDFDVALVAVALAFDSPETEDILRFIKGQILNWLNSR
jgi:hypothetical protein